jgi:hypothetical protein
LDSIFSGTWLRDKLAFSVERVKLVTADSNLTAPVTSMECSVEEQDTLELLMVEDLTGVLIEL